MIGTRRHRVDRIVQIGTAAKCAADAIRSAGPARLSPELAAAIDALLLSADIVVKSTKEELLFLEESRNWGEES